MGNCQDGSSAKPNRSWQRYQRCLNKPDGRVEIRQDLSRGEIKSLQLASYPRSLYIAVMIVPSIYIISLSRNYLLLQTLSHLFFISFISLILAKLFAHLTFPAYLYRKRIYNSENQKNSSQKTGLPDKLSMFFIQQQQHDSVQEKTIYQKMPRHKLKT